MAVKLTVFVTGQRAFGEAAYNLCKARGLTVAGVSAPPVSSGGVLRDRLRCAAENDGVPWIPSGTLNADTLPEGIDLIIAAHSHDFIGRRTRLRSRLGAVGYHPSLLPLHRGRDAVRWAIHNRDRVTGGSVYWLTDNIDAGPIAAQGHCFIRPKDTPETLWRRELFPIGISLLDVVLRDLTAGRIVARPQRSELSTWEPSFERSPIFRPDLTLIGPGLEDFTLVNGDELCGFPNYG